MIHVRSSAWPSGYEIVWSKRKVPSASGVPRLWTRSCCGAFIRILRTGSPWLGPAKKTSGRKAGVVAAGASGPAGGVQPATSVAVTRNRARRTGGGG